MSWLTHFIPPKINPFSRKNDTKETLWHQCLGCQVMIFHKDFKENQYVCPHCDHHHFFPPRERLGKMFDGGLYENLQCPGVQDDPLGFRDQKKYTDRLKTARQNTQEKEAFVSAYGSIGGYPAVVFVFDFRFIGGSMGMALGNGLLHSARHAATHNAAFVVIPSSGGARMQEGILSLMQMPRSLIALQYLREKTLPSIVLMTHPTTGGTLASFAMMGDIVMAEPKAIIGFTGARVIQETLKTPLPEGFQRSEFQYDHGFVDILCHRHNIEKTLGNIFSVLMKKDDMTQKLVQHNYR